MTPPTRPPFSVLALIVPAALAALLLATGCARHAAAPADGHAGYAEADMVPLASSADGRIARLPVRRGERAPAGAPLFALAGQPAQRAAADVEVVDVMVREDEAVRAGQAVLTLFDRRQLRARVFVPAAQAATLAPGQIATLSCDGCGAGLPARISFVARRPEPGRDDGAVLAEARPDDGAADLRPGQPLTVHLAGR